MDFSTLKVDELKVKCRELKLKGWSSLKKKELIEFLTKNSSPNEGSTSQKFDLTEKKIRISVKSNLAEIIKSLFTKEECLSLGEEIVRESLLYPKNDRYCPNDIGMWIGRSLSLESEKKLRTMKVKLELENIKASFSDYFSFDDTIKNLSMEETDRLKYSIWTYSDFNKYFRNILLRIQKIKRGMITQPFTEESDNLPFLVGGAICDSKSKIENVFPSLSYLPVRQKYPGDENVFTLIYIYFTNENMCEARSVRVTGTYDDLSSRVNDLIKVIPLEENPMKINIRDKPRTHLFCNKPRSGKASLSDQGLEAVLLFAKIYPGEYSLKKVEEDYLSRNIDFWRNCEIDKCLHYFRKIGGTPKFEVENVFSDGKEREETMKNFIFENLKKREEYIILDFYLLMKNLNLTGKHPVDDLREYHSDHLRFLPGNLGDGEYYLNLWDIKFKNSGFDWYQNREIKSVESTINFLVELHFPEKSESEEIFPLNLLMLKEVVYLHTLDIFKKKSYF